MPVAINGNGPITGLGPLAQCRLTRETSSGVLLLYPIYGNQLYIGGRNQTVPNTTFGGITLSATGLTINTTYFIYAYMNGATMTLEASTAGYIYDSSTGICFKNGDGSRTLVGMARTTGSGPAWSNNDTTSIGVISWFNRQPRMARGFYTADRTTSINESAYSEIDGGIRCNFLNWQDEIVGYDWDGHITANGTGTNMLIALAIDSVVTPTRYTQIFNANSGWAFTFRGSFRGSSAEGFHYATMLSRAAGSTSVTYYGSTDTSRCTQMIVTTQG